MSHFEQAEEWLATVEMPQDAPPVVMRRRSARYRDFGPDLCLKLAEIHAQLAIIESKGE